MTLPHTQIQRCLPHITWPSNTKEYGCFTPVAGMHAMTQKQTLFSIFDNDNHSAYRSFLKVKDKITHNDMRGVSMCLMDEDLEDEYVLIELIFHSDREPILLQDPVSIYDAVACWRFWADTLNVSLFLVDEELNFQEIIHKTGFLITKPQTKRRTQTLKARRPNYVCRRMSRYHNGRSQNISL